MNSEEKSGVKKPVPSSFRDPSGFLYFQGDLIYRQVNIQYKDDYDRLIDSGLYHTLVKSELLIPHEEVATEYAASSEAYKVIKPELIPFLSFPYEWSFSQLKDAALITLEIQGKALDFGMSLKDSSAYNIQFRKGKPVLIDTLSFETYREGQPWVAYRQFCQHFLAPLALMSYADVRLGQLLRVYIDGIPLDLASSLLPFSTYMKFSLLTHIHLHAKSQKRFARRAIRANSKTMTRLAFLGLIDNLKSSVSKLSWKPPDTEWSNYYLDSSYASEALLHKKQLVSEFLDKMNPKPQCVWDLGSNVGLFSRIASDKGILTISCDMDSACVEKNYFECIKNQETDLLPLLLDLTNPSPSLGWENQERISFLKRKPGEAVLALALVHHLAISNNLSLHKVADFFSQICKWLIIEFVPKNDCQVKKLLLSRGDIFPNYTQEVFETEFRKYFTILGTVKVRHTERTIYWMKRDPNSPRQ
ncbi:MAG: SAM-dependent methyltransferase [Acidobacteria bacterium]|nr:MAG: SAM-dependent methyltransferase [Acidobacteriota bacterium]